MLYLLRLAEIGSEPQTKKSKIKNDVIGQLRSKLKNAGINDDIGRIFIETSDINAEEILKNIHGIVSFSPVINSHISELEEITVLLAKEILRGKKSFGIKIKRIGDHPFTSQELADKLGKAIKKSMPAAKVNLKDPEEAIFVEIRGNDSYIFNRIIPGIDRQKRIQQKIPQEHPKFIVDDMLGKLAKRLRLLGFDASYPKTSADSFLLRRSKEEDRIILTRDLGLTKVSGANATFIKTKILKEQVEEVLNRFKLKITPEQIFSRCVKCNNELVKIGKEKIKGKVPPLVYNIFDDFTFCPFCKKIFWKGTHFEKLNRFISRLSAET